MCVRARNAQAADFEGRIELAASFPDFGAEGVRVVAMVEVY